MLNPHYIIDQRIVFGSIKEIQMQPNGIDLTIDSLKEFRCDGGHLLQQKTIVKEKDDVKLQNGMYRLSKGIYDVQFKQKADFPANVAGIIIPRSSVGRLGGIIVSGLYDSGFNGQLGCTLHVQVPITIEEGSRLAQIVCFKADSYKLYDGQWQE